jgi:hypothetical protein
MGAAVAAVLIRRAVGVFAAVTTVWAAAVAGVAPSAGAVTSADPTFWDMLPTPFSPNGDGVRDTTQARFDLPFTESTSISVTNSVGATVRGPIALGSLTEGTHHWTWAGRTNSSTRAADGTYRVTINTTAVRDGVTVHGQASRTVRLDTVAPRMSDITANKTTFDPSPVGYQGEWFFAYVTVYEPVTLALRIWNSNGQVVDLDYFHFGSGAGGGGQAFSGWDGEIADRLAPAGAYSWRWFVRDTAGNRRISAARTVNVAY